MIEALAYLRDLDGTGSLHVCAMGDPGAIAVVALDDALGTALAAATRRAKTPKAVECEASQSGPKGNAQRQS